jgi:putative SbcD/Mre11-related phosphoesterase
MDRSRLELAPGICLDARCAVFLADTDTLAVADLHLGYAWAHRARGNLLPICAGEDTLPRLRELIDDYAPREVALLGDIVHAAVRAEPLLDELRALAALAERVPLRLIAGNHDAQLQRLLQQSAIGLTLARELVAEPHLLLHGDAADESGAAALLATIRGRGGRLVFGHEHPALSLSDGVASSARCPCFLVAEEALVLPAFSTWAAGSNVRGSPFLSAYSRAVRFTQAVAIVAGKLLPVPL